MQDLTSERDKWDGLYAHLNVSEISEEVQALSDEIFQIVSEILPYGGRVLEAGCGSGAQSLGLSKDGSYEITLLDFSREALAHARKVYEANKGMALFRHGDLFEHGEREFDLVYNFGVLEHYTFDQQVAAIRAMASRSSKYVAVAVPNSGCYWYWLWRTLCKANGHWPYGQEVPARDLQNAFENAGLSYVGHRFVASRWAESFIAAIGDLSPALKCNILELHRSKLLPDAQTAYLTLALGIVGGVPDRGTRPPSSLHWTTEPYPQEMAVAEQAASLSDNLALVHSLRRNLAEKQDSLLLLEEAKSKAQAELSRLETHCDRSHAEKSLLAKDLQSAQAEIARLRGDLDITNSCRNDLEFRVRALESSTSWKITAPLRRLRDFPAVSRHKSPPWSFAMRGFSKLREEGAAIMLRKVLALAGTYGIAETATRICLRLQQPESQNNEHNTYLEHTRAQARYIRAYIEQPIPSRQLRLSRFFRDTPSAGRVILAPVAYDLELRQRPDHLLEALTNAGYVCIQLVLDVRPRFIRRRRNGVYLTNMYEEALAFFARSSPILYLHYPRFRYLADVIPDAFAIYDVLDDFSIFSGSGPEMAADHIALLKSADVVLFSSPELFDRNREICRRTFLIQNGVWPEHFDVDAAPPRGPRGSPTLIRVGYHGAISELLDFDLLNRIAEIPNVELVLVGPVAAFDPDLYPALERSFAELMQRNNVVHRGKLPYERVRGYLSEIDVGIIPFIPSQATNAVSPLKLFEFIAARKPVLATRTATLLQFDDAIVVGSPDELVGAIRSGRWSNFDVCKYGELLDTHSWEKLAAPLIEFIKTRKPAGGAHASPKAIERIDILNVSFFDWDGNRLYKGGAERYVSDLAELSRKLGKGVRLLQNANRPFERTINGFPVIGVPSHVASWDFRVISKAFSKQCIHADLVIASPLELAACIERERQPIVGINHGVHWDAAGNRHHIHDGLHRQLVVEALLRSAETVAVDTNFINWARTVDWELARSIRYIPNYVDLGAFKAVEKDFTGSLHVLYPRRLYRARGLDLTIDAFDSLLLRRADIQLTLCGQANEDDSERVRDFVGRHQGRVTWVEREFDQMYSVFRESHVVLIPTLHSEGTSLSCIEAMATNNVVIATDIGGLPNLIINGFNGVLIPPDANELIKAVELLYGDRALCARLAANATSTSSAFAHSHWVGQWRDVVESVSHLM